MNNLYIQPEDNDNMTDQIPRSKLLSKIDELEAHYGINMQKELIASELIPLYFNVKQNNLNTVTYEFEVNEGSASITVFNFGSDYTESWEINDVLDDHIFYLQSPGAFDSIDDLLD